MIEVIEVGDEDVDEGDEEARQRDDQRVQQLSRHLKKVELLILGKYRVTH